MKQIIHVLSGTNVLIWRGAWSKYSTEEMVIEALIADLNSSNCAHEFGLEDTRPFQISEFIVVEIP